MWTAAIYDLGLSASEFFELTPRQFSLLLDRHRTRLTHREMIQAYTTAAVINYSLGAPEESVQPTSFMPHYKPSEKDSSDRAVKFTEDELFDWQMRVEQLAAEMKQGHGKTLDAIRSRSNG